LPLFSDTILVEDKIQTSLVDTGSSLSGIYGCVMGLLGFLVMFAGYCVNTAPAQTQIIVLSQRGSS
jgi:hypothetical protein